MKHIEEFKKFLEGKKKAKETIRKDENCYCIEGAMCEFYRLKTKHGKWLKRKGEWYFELNKKSYKVAPNSVLKYFGLSGHIYHINDNTRLTLKGILKQL